MASGLATVTPFVASAILLGLAVWLLVLRFASPVHRAFSVLLTLFALRIIFLRFANLTDDAAWTHLWRDMAMYATFWLWPAVGWFLLVYIPAGKRDWQKWALIPVLAIGAAGAFVLALNDCAALCVANDAVAYGPLAWANSGLPVLWAAAALALAIRSAKEPHAPRARAELLVATSFSLAATFLCVQWAALLVENTFGGAIEGATPRGLAIFDAILPLLAAPLILATWVLQGMAATRLDLRYGIRNTAVLYAATIAMGMLTGRMLPTASIPLVAGGVTQILLGVLIAFALVRHRLFNVNTRIRWTFARGMIGASFVTLFFIVSEWAAAFFGDRTESSILGILAASLLVFFMAPMQRVADKLSRQVVPSETPLERLKSSEKKQLYRDQVVLVWGDGTMGLKERALLDQLRERLAITYADAGQIEHEAIAAQHLRESAGRAA